MDRGTYFIKICSSRLVQGLLSCEADTSLNIFVHARFWKCKWALRELSGKLMGNSDFQS